MLFTSKVLIIILGGGSLLFNKKDNSYIHFAEEKRN